MDKNQRDDEQILIDEDQVQNQYGVSKVAAHTHNRTDSLAVDANNLEFSVPYFKLFSATSTPGALVKNAICAVNGTLYICDGVSWIKVGSQ